MWKYRVATIGQEGEHLFVASFLPESLSEAPATKAPTETRIHVAGEKFRSFAEADIAYVSERKTARGQMRSASKADLDQVARGPALWVT